MQEVLGVFKGQPEVSVPYSTGCIARPSPPVLHNRHVQPTRTLLPTGLPSLVARLHVDLMRVASSVRSFAS
jgi:hypothetical protein